MYSLIRPCLFCLPAEMAHTLALSALRYIPSACFASIPSSPVTAMGLTFPHAIGLAAGLDKNARYLTALEKLGFAFIEVGTLTPRPQSGNPKPRLFRLTKAHALINRMGFNNDGVEAVVNRIRRSRYTGILGINLGKQKETPLNQAAEDYLYGLNKVYPYASYVTINISSPNTPDLRLLQQGAYFKDLLHQLRQAQLHLADRTHRHVPLVIKISPDESSDHLKTMAEIIQALGIEGIIATNTTCAREGVAGLPFADEAGGLSGAPLAASSTACLRLLKSIVGDDVTLIGAGGIDNPTTAHEKLTAGADLLQVYTGLIYEGPGLVRRLTHSTI